MTKMLDDIEDQHGQRQADIVLGIIRKMANWYTARNDDYLSPVVHGMHRSNGSDRKRKRILADEEIRAVWSACDDLKDDEWIIATAPREKGQCRHAAAAANGARHHPGAATDCRQPSGV